VLERVPDKCCDEEELYHPLAREAAAERLQRPPPSVQPRVHVIAACRLADVYTPLLPPPQTADESAALCCTRGMLPGLRQAVVGGLTSCLGGDALAAEYVLLGALSRILVRHGDAPIGKLHVNVTGCPAASPPATRSPVATSLQAALGELFPVCASQSLAIGVLNDTQLAPVKDHEANCIWPAALQLPAGSALLLDEAMLAPGALNDRGLRNMRALASVLDTQTVPYDFTYFSVDFNIDVSVLAVSASKSMLPINCQVPLRVSPCGPPPGELAQLEVRQSAQRYLGLAARMQYNLSAIGDELSKVAQDDFVAARQVDSSVSADDFARLLTVSRLVAALALAPSVSMEHYTHAKQLEAMRAARVRSREVAV